MPRRPSPPSHLRVVAALLRITIVDDDVAILRSFRRALKLRRPTWDVTTISNADDALSQVAQNHCDVFVTDYEMPNVDGVQLLAKVHANFPRVKRIVLSGRPIETASGLPPNVVEAWVSKGHGVDELIEAVEDLMSKAPALNTNSGTG